MDQFLQRGGAQSRFWCSRKSVISQWSKRYDIRKIITTTHWPFTLSRERDREKKLSHIFFHAITQWPFTPSEVFLCALCCPPQGVDVHCVNFLEEMTNFFRALSCPPLGVKVHCVKSFGNRSTLRQIFWNKMAKFFFVHCLVLRREQKYTASNLLKIMTKFFCALARPALGVANLDYNSFTPKKHLQHNLVLLVQQKSILRFKKYHIIRSRNHTKNFYKSE